MKAKINDTLIAGLGLNSKGYAVCDTELAGFRVWVAPSGIKSFQLSYTIDGKKWIPMTTSRITAKALIRIPFLRGAMVFKT